MAANVQITVSGPLVEMVDAILAQRPDGGQGQPAAREAYLMSAVTRAIEADAAKFARPTLGQFIRRPS